jgi:hypothetical protein
MATANGQPGYKLSLLPAAADALRLLRDQAVLRGLAERLARDLESVERRLQRDPVEWGDPLFDYHHLGMTRRRGKSEFLYVYYSVHEPGRAVFVQDITANPHGPLAADASTA